MPKLKGKKKEEKNIGKNEKLSKYQTNLKSDKVREREIKIKFVKIAILISILFLVIIYFILRVVYQMGDFTITLDPQSGLRSGLVMFESLQDRQSRDILHADELEFMDNISVNWLPSNLNDEADGGHNGENYIAYTFYVENQGSNMIDYWYDIHIDDVIKNVDTAVRVMIYLNGENTIYAKANGATGGAETGTEVFYSDEYVVMKERANMNPGDLDKFTIVIWIEGDDPDCLDPLIGGEMKMTMHITEEHNAPQ